MAGAGPRTGSVAVAGLLLGVLLILRLPAGPLPPVGVLLDPADGLYRNARAAQPRPGGDASVAVPGVASDANVYFDERGVPHIFANDVFDAVRALGYVVARDRLFQFDFVTRVAAGRLSELMGSATIEADRFLRNTGMEYGARMNAARIEREDATEAALIRAYCDGINTYIDGLRAADLPLEYRLLGGVPARCSILQVARILQYMTFDLSYRSDEADYAELRRRLDPSDYELLYPQHSRLYVPIVPSKDSPKREGRTWATIPPSTERMLSALQAPRGIPVAEGHRHGKGSNNWAVTGDHSTTGAPILAGDMHLALTLPAIWYEAHLVTPEMNTYGVTIPGAPLLVEAFNEYVGWAFTNTGSDQIDHYALELNSSRTRYRYEGAWRPLELQRDTIRVAGGEPVIDTLYYSHWGPVFMDGEQPVAIQWVAHKSNGTLGALYDMNRATDYAAFEEAIRGWDSPMQNVLYAGRDGTVAIRSTGHLPIRRGGHGIGVLDGASAEGEWIGRVPFEELPHALNPEQGFLTSTNQQPASPEYPHYLGHDWRDSFRSLRAQELLSAQELHSVDDLKRYQADVVAQQHLLFRPILDTLGGLPAGPDSLRKMLVAWDGTTAVDRPEPLILDEFIDALEEVTWDEDIFRDVKKPAQTSLYVLLTEQPLSKWFNRPETERDETAGDVLRIALQKAYDGITDEHGPDPAAWRWGDHHQVIFRHVTGAEALRPFWRGPLEYPGFTATLSPAGSRTTTHSASWRVVVDFSTMPPSGWGIYPGGQSGDPLNPLYDRHIDDYVRFEYYRLQNSGDEETFRADAARRLVFRPSSRDS